MKKLTKREEDVMNALWTIKEGFVKDIIARFPEPKPHYNTISTIVRHLASDEIGFIGHKSYGKSHMYFPLVKKEDYKDKPLDKLVSNYFNNSYKEMVAYFAKEQRISKDDLKDIMDLINKE